MVLTFHHTLCPPPFYAQRPMFDPTLGLQRERHNQRVGAASGLRKVSLHKKGIGAARCKSQCHFKDIPNRERERDRKKERNRQTEIQRYRGAGEIQGEIGQREDRA